MFAHSICEGQMITFSVPIFRVQESNSGTHTCVACPSLLSRLTWLLTYTWGLLFHWTLGYIEHLGYIAWTVRSPLRFCLPSQPLRCVPIPGFHVVAKECKLTSSCLFCLHLTTGRSPQPTFHIFYKTFGKRSEAWEPDAPKLSKSWPWHSSPRDLCFPGSQWTAFPHCGVGFLAGWDWLVVAGGSDINPWGPWTSFCDSAGPSSFLPSAFLPYLPRALQSSQTFQIWPHGVFQGSLPIKSHYPWWLCFVKDCSVCWCDVQTWEQNSCQIMGWSVLFWRKVAISSMGRQLTFWCNAACRTIIFCYWLLTLSMWTHACTYKHMLLSVNMAR